MLSSAPAPTFGAPVKDGRSAALLFAGRRLLPYGRGLRERNGQPTDPVFPKARGHALRPEGVEYLLDKHTIDARQHCPSLGKKRVTPHVLRHSAAMELLQHGVDRSVIALWLGHESTETTQMYLHADLELKEKALAKASPLGIKMRRYRPDDKLLAFLKAI